MKPLRDSSLLALAGLWLLSIVAWMLIFGGW
jgi:hypothetical protein